MRRINIMHVIRDMGPGGAERVVLNYIKHMDRSRFLPKLCVLGRPFPKELKEIRNLDVNFAYFNKSTGWDTRTLLGLASLIKKERINILHLHNFSAQLYGTIAALISTRPVIFRTEHNVLNRYHGFLGMAKLKFKIIMGLFHEKIITVSEKVKESHLRHDRYFRHKYVTIYNGVDAKLFDVRIDAAKYRQQFGFSRDNLVIGKVASMYPQKAHKIFFHAAKVVLDEIPTARFLVVGDGPLRSDLESMVHRMGLEKEILFTGVRGDVPSLLQFMDIFVLSSAWEGFPMTILEAMASSTPAVVTDVGGNREAVVDGETGYLVRQEEPHALANAIIELGKNSQQRESMGRTSRKRVLKHFTAQGMVRKTEQLYLQAFKASLKGNNMTKQTEG